MTQQFDATSTADDVLGALDLTGKRFLITGAASGVGAETARALAARGAAVVGAVRDPAKNMPEIDNVRATAQQAGGSLDLVALDLSALASVRACAEELVADGHRFDGVIANAGVMATPFGLTEDGFEQQFGINHLGHFVLVNRIAPLIREGGRMVSLSSNGHRGADVDLDDPNFTRAAYDMWTAYGRSKTANALFAVEFDRRHRARGVGGCSVMPGTSDTPLMRHLSDADRDAVFRKIDADRAAKDMGPLLKKTVGQMAATSVWAAVVADAEEIGGRYLEDCHIAPIDDRPGVGDGVMSYALDPESARRLWTRSEELVGEHF
jgi:NAD(P)-dependent dehydrogenase (short-subunit alcohol dehydrogenase family)